MRPAAALFDANRYLLAGLIERLGAKPTDLGILPDDADALQRALAAAAEDHDLVLTSGGVSTGEADHVRAAIERIGRLVFWRVGIKPGRPVAMGVIPGSRGKARRKFCGLPGNPVAVFVTFARSGARCCCVSRVPSPSRSCRCRCARPSRIASAGAGGNMCGSSSSVPPMAASTPSSTRRTVPAWLTSLTETDGLIELPEDVTTAVKPGATVGFLDAALTGEICTD